MQTWSRLSLHCLHNIDIFDKIIKLAYYKLCNRRHQRDNNRITELSISLRIRYSDFEGVRKSLESRTFSRSQSSWILTGLFNQYF